MAYRLTGTNRTITENIPLLSGMFACYDTIGDPSFDMDRDETLHERSAYEFVRGQLSPEQIAELDKVDAYWRAHPKEFNEDFKIIQGWEDRKTALEGFVEDEDGKVPAIPRSHWWWWPIPMEKESKKGR
ncbi:MAG: hypothetical protein V6Z86_07470 [Hyphomicrobiales bacterium]